MILFADNSHLFIKGKNLDNMTQTLNKELHLLVDWLRANKLSLNILKTNYMIFSPNRNVNIPDLDIGINN